MFIPNPFLLGLLPWHTKRVPSALPYTVIIPMHNKAKAIGQTLDSLFNQTRKPNHVIIIDDCSTDGSTEVVKGLGYDLDLVELPTNLGKPGAINEALKRVEDPRVLILDADTKLSTNYTELVLQGFTENVVGVCGRVLPAKRDTMCQKSRLVEYLCCQRMAKTFETKIGGMWVLTGCATMWDTAWVKSVGGMPNKTLVEDLELSWKAQKKHRSNYIHEAFCYTEDPASFKEYLSQIYRWYSWRPALTINDFKEFRKGLKAIISWTMIDAALASFFTFLILAFFIMGRIDQAVYLVFVDWMFFSAIACHQGYQIGKLTEVFEGLPYIVVLRYVNVLVYLIAFIRPKKRWY